MEAITSPRGVDVLPADKFTVLGLHIAGIAKIARWVLYVGQPGNLDDFPLTSLESEASGERIPVHFVEG